MKLSLVAPCYNEESNVKRFFDAVKSAFDGNVTDYEIVFVNDGSKDGTYKELKKLYDENKKEATFVRRPERSELNADINEALIVEFYSRV